MMSIIVAIVAEYYVALIFHADGYNHKMWSCLLSPVNISSDTKVHDKVALLSQISYSNSVSLQYKEQSVIWLTLKSWHVFVKLASSVGKICGCYLANDTHYSPFQSTHKSIINTMSTS